MKIIKNIALAMTLSVTSIYTQAQCPSGQAEVTLDVTTDNFGYETYWEIVPSGNACGVGTIGSGGSAIVGCNGGGVRVQNVTAGYGNSQTYNEGPWCLTAGACYDLIFVDDWGDGGGEFKIKVNGYSIGDSYRGVGSTTTFTFCASEPATYDVATKNIISPALYAEAGLNDVTGILSNPGTMTITSLDLNYKVGNNSTQTVSLTGLNIAHDQTYNFVHSTQWNAPIGTSSIKVWASNLNGNSDLNNANDTITKTIEVSNSIPNIIDSYLSITPVINQIVNSSNLIDRPTDLDFHPQLSRKELWIVNERTEAVGGSTVTINDAGLPSQTSQMLVDGNAWHFMSLPTGIAFSKNGNFATSPGVFDANHNGGAPFTGPSLWSSDLSIYAQNAGPGTNGSHLDMLHESPYSRGIASEKDNVFWVFDGNSDDIVRYDFVDDHGPGNDYHGDAIISRYSDFAVAKDPNNKVVSHLVVNDGWVYVTDYGNQKIFRIQMNTGTIGGPPSFAATEPLATYNTITGYVSEDVVITGLVEPAGIDIIGNRMIVSDYSTGEVIIYDISTMPAIELGRISTGAAGIMGVKIGPDGKIWYVDYDANTVNLIDGLPVSLDEFDLSNKISIYPNPAKDNLSINIKGVFQPNTVINVFDITGKIVHNETMSNNLIMLKTENWKNGFYQVKITNNTSTFVEKVIIQH